MTPVRPMAFLTSMDAVITVSVASANVLPTMGTKLPAIYLAALRLTPSATELEAPCTEITPRNIVSRMPSNATLMLRSRSAS
ncbi:hypothetical protein D3C76_1527360 [compost metagenome]